MKQNSNNTDVTINSDGFSIGGGTTPRKIGVTGGDACFVSAAADATYTLPAAPATIPAATDLHTQGTDSGTTGNAFTVDSDSETGKIIIDAALGSADKSLTITNEALTDDVVITLPATTGTVALAAALHTQNTDTGTTETGFKVDTGNSGPQIINNGGVMEIKNSAGDAYADLKCKDLTVSGTTTTISSTTVDVGDNIIVLNSGEDGTPSADAGIEVERGTSDNAQLLWNETADRFQAGVTGALETLAYTSEIPTGDTAEELTADKNPAEINHSYIANKAATACAITLPAAAVVGSELKIVGKGATGWTLLQVAGQQIHFGNVSTTVGAGGSLASSATRDCISLICVVADTTWEVYSAVGNITVV